MTCNVPFEPQNQATHPLSHALLYRTTRSFAFYDGDTLSFKDTGNNGVLQIVSITYKCGGTASSLCPMAIMYQTHKLPPPLCLFVVQRAAPLM